MKVVTLLVESVKNIIFMTAEHMGHGMVRGILKKKLLIMEIETEGLKFLRQVISKLIEILWIAF